MIGRISVFVNPYKEEAYTVAKHIISICEHKDIACSVAHNADELSSCELIAAIGGDGTLLRTAERAAILDIPVLGVNLGRIGFLSEVAPDEFENALEMIDKGDYKVQNLMMLECYVNSRRIAAALNDVIVYKPKFFEIAYFRSGHILRGHFAAGCIYLNALCADCRSFFDRCCDIRPEAVNDNTDRKSAHSKILLLVFIKRGALYLSAL